MQREPKPKLWQRWRWTWLHQLLHDNRGARYFVAAVGLTVATGLGVLGWMWSQPQAQMPDTYAAKTKKPAPKKPYSPLTGVEVVDEAATRRQVTAVMVENSPDARPQSGLKDAGIVFEAVAEGGITRFIALYQEARPGLIGPVRSVRPYYVEWAAAFDPAVAHIGGSARALDMIRSGNYGVDLDQFFNAGTYWRSSDRVAPHNVYTSFDKLDELTAAKSKTSSSFTALPRKDEKAAKTPTTSRVVMPISSQWYEVVYDYDAATNTYKRSVGGAPHVDREGGLITPKTVIAMQVQMTNAYEDGNREQIVTAGTGRAWVFQDGTLTEATWSKGDPKGQLSFTGADGKPVNLNRGQTWVTALPNERVPTWQ